MVQSRFGEQKYGGANTNSSSVTVALDKSHKVPIPDSEGLLHPFVPQVTDNVFVNPEESPTFSEILLATLSDPLVVAFKKMDVFDVAEQGVSSQSPSHPPRDAENDESIFAQNVSEDWYR